MVILPGAQSDLVNTKKHTSGLWYTLSHDQRKSTAMGGAWKFVELGTSQWHKFDSRSSVHVKHTLEIYCKWSIVQLILQVKWADTLIIGLFIPS